MRRLFLLCTTASLVAIVVAAPSFSKRNSPVQLAEAGWSCPVLLGAVHCLPPGTGLKSPESPSLTALVFEGTDPSDADASFLGTEHVLRGRVREGRPSSVSPGPPDLRVPGPADDRSRHPVLRLPPLRQLVLRRDQ